MRIFQRALAVFVCFFIFGLVEGYSASTLIFLTRTNTFLIKKKEGGSLIVEKTSTNREEYLPVFSTVKLIPGKYNISLTSEYYGEYEPLGFTAEDNTIYFIALDGYTMTPRREIFILGKIRENDFLEDQFCIVFGMAIHRYFTIPGTDGVKAKLLSVAPFPQVKFNDKLTEKIKLEDQNLTVFEVGTYNFVRRSIDGNQTIEKDDYGDPVEYKFDHGFYYIDSYQKKLRIKKMNLFFLESPF